MSMTKQVLYRISLRFLYAVTTHTHQPTTHRPARGQSSLSSAGVGDDACIAFHSAAGGVCVSRCICGSCYRSIESGQWSCWELIWLLIKLPALASDKVLGSVVCTTRSIGHTYRNQHGDEGASPFQVLSSLNSHGPNKQCNVYYIPFFLWWCGALTNINS
jgi:hypothetical protein